MKNKQKAKIIVDVIRMYAVSATREYINAEADLAKTQMGHDIWEKEYTDDLSMNPYKIEPVKKIVVRKQEERLARKEVLKYAIDVFLEKIPEDNS